MDNDALRETLEFQNAISKYFGFLIDSYGFRCFCSSLYVVRYVRYSTQNIYVSIYHDRISFELDFIIEYFIKDGNRRLIIDFGDIVEFYNLGQQILYRASNNESVFSSVKDISDTIFQYSNDLFGGSPEHFNKIIEQRDKKQQEALLTASFHIAEQKAHKAWLLKDYETVVAQYNQYAELLSAVQLKMLSYSKKQINLKRNNSSFDHT